jgi:hypothetical protein
MTYSSGRKACGELIFRVPVRGYEKGCSAENVEFPAPRHGCARVSSRNACPRSHGVPSRSTSGLHSRLKGLRAWFRLRSRGPLVTSTGLRDRSHQDSGMASRHIGGQSGVVPGRGLVVSEHVYESHRHDRALSKHLQCEAMRDVNDLPLATRNTDKCRCQCGPPSLVLDDTSYGGHPSHACRVSSP